MAIRVDGTKNLMATYYSTLAAYGSLHTSDPGTTGTSEVVGGSYVRVLISWGTAGATAPGVIIGVATFNVPASTTVTWGGAWSAITAGTFRDDVDVIDQAFTPAGSLAVTFSFTQI